MGIRGRKPRPYGFKVLQGGVSDRDEREWRKRTATCGQPTSSGTPCRRPAGHGTDRSAGPCYQHLEEATPGVDSVTDPPTFLPEKAKELWSSLAPKLETTDRFTPEDVPAFTSLCLSYYFALLAGATLLKDGIVDVDEAHAGRRRKHPAWQMWRDAQGSFRQWACEFGLTPSSRTRFEIPETTELSRMERLLRGD